MEDNTDPLSITKDVGESGVFLQFFDDLRRVKYLGRPVFASPDASINVLNDLFLGIHPNQVLLVTYSHFLFSVLSN